MAGFSFQLTLPFDVKKIAGLGQINFAVYSDYT